MGQRVNIATHEGYKGDIRSGFAYYLRWKNNIEGTIAVTLIAITLTYLWF